MTTVQDPATFHQQWSELFDSHDIDGLVGLYDPACVLVVGPGRTVTGTEIGPALQALRADADSLVLQPPKVLRSGDTAILYADYVLTFHGPNGRHATGVTSDVLRRQADGSWLMVIDNPLAGDC